MTRIQDIESLEALYEAKPSAAAMDKVAHHMTPLYRQWIMSSRFCVLGTVGPEGTDTSPRGDDGPVVAEIDTHTLAMPDWRGNNRLDSLRNIVRDGRVSRMFMVPGAVNVVRVNGAAHLETDPDLRARFARNERLPRTVIVIEIAEIYSQCARAILRSRLWTGADESADLPSVGDILTEMTEGAFDGAEYDLRWSDRAQGTMW